MKAEKLAKIRAGEKGAVGAKPAEQKAIAKKFYGQLVTDSHYVGDDYDVFGAWLGSKAKGAPPSPDKVLPHELSATPQRVSRVQGGTDDPRLLPKPRAHGWCHWLASLVIGCIRGM